MKKKILSILMCVLALSCVLTGCSKKKKTTEPAPITPTSEGLVFQLWGTPEATAP